ncbi:MAG: ABC transporter permease [Cyclobacteriaceae bacterium]|nr:ABC transporter permease [Cyclobacteriaceae bacterium]
MATFSLSVTLSRLFRQKGFAFTSILGLAIGMAACVLIAMFVLDELSYDRYHKKGNRIHRLVNMGGHGVAKVSGQWGTSAKAEIPEVEEMTRFVLGGQLFVKVNEKSFYENNMLYADPSVFNMFSFHLLEGSPDKALTEPNSVVITEEVNKRYFGDASGLGQSILIQGDDFKVTGIMQNVPANSHFMFTHLMSMENHRHPDKESWVRWNQFYTYVLVREGSNPDAIPAAMKGILARNLDASVLPDFSAAFQSLYSIHLRSHLSREMQANSDILYLYLFSAIAILILVISCANFVNLFTAQAASRAKEIGVRKVSGAVRTQLVVQFLSESLLITVMALALAQLFAYLALPTLNSLTEKNLSIDYLDQPMVLLVIIGLAVTTALLAGLYPAFYLSSLKPANVIKGKWSVTRGGALRKSLVTFQFALSSLLVIASSIVIQQLDYIQGKPLGFDPQQVINIPINNPVFLNRRETVKEELLAIPGVVSVSLSGNLPGGSDWGLPTIAEGFTQETLPDFRVLAVDHDFLKTYGMQLVAGRDFSVERASDSATYLINEEAARQLQWSTPLQKNLGMPAINRAMAPVVGVVKDFHFRSMHEKIGPIVFFIPPAEWLTRYSIRVSGDDLQASMEKIEALWKKLDPEHPFIYSFFDQQYQQLYQRERRLSTIVYIFTGVGVFLACLGLYSLAALSTEERTKEIGIRKAIGATTHQIVMMISSGFAKLVLIGFVVALPLSIWLAQQWLGTFAYRTGIDVFLLAAAFLLLALLSLLTVARQAYSAGKRNPVTSLRSE